MIYRINFAVLRAHLEIQENALERIKNMFDTLNCLKILGESEGDFVAAMEGLEVELKELLGKQADIFHISTASLSRFIEAVVPLLRPVNEEDDVVYDAPGMAKFVSDVEYEVCDMAERTKKPFWYTTRLSADRAEKNRGLIEHNQKVANGVQEKYWETYWNAVNKLEEIKETIKPWKEFEQVDLDLGDAMRQQLIDSGGMGVWISETLSDIKDDFDPAIGFVLSVKDALVGCVELGVYAIDYLATFLVWCLNIGMDDDNPETARIRQKFDDYNQTICDSGEVILTTILKGTGDLVTDPVRAGRNIDSFMVDATNDQAVEYGLTPSGDVGAAIVLGNLVDPFKGAGKLSKVSKVSKISKFSKYEKFVDNGMPVVRTGYGKLKVVDRTGMIKEMQEVAAGPPGGVGKVDDIASVGPQGTRTRPLKLTKKEAVELDWLPDRYAAVEIEGAVKVGGQELDVSRRIYQIEIDKTYKPLDPEAGGLTNKQLMEKGKSPYVFDSNGIESKVELHHLTQTEPGGMVEIAESTHDLYAKPLHGLVEDGSSFRNDPVLDKQYKNFKNNYWKFRSAN